MGIFTKSEMNEIMFQRELINKATQVGYIVVEPGARQQERVEAEYDSLTQKKLIEKFRRIAAQHAAH